MPPATPRVRDPDAVRTAVLDAALPLFAQRGFADTSLRDISAASGVSHPLILHHFGSKDDLYAAVKRRVVEGFARRFPEASRVTDEPIDVHAEMQRIMTYVGENTLALKLCARTRVDGDHQVWPGEPDLFDLLRQRIEVAQRMQRVRADVDATLVSIMIMGLVFFWLDNREHFAQRFQKPSDDQAYLMAAVNVIQEGLVPRTAESP